jgi:two-component sensor histidine kinase
LDKVRELDALRGRLVRVEDDERSALVADLRSGPLATLTQLHSALVAGGAAPQLVEQLHGTERDIADVAAGLDPLAGSAKVADAVHRLAGQLGAIAEVALEVELDVTTGRALWFACSEALANAAKHAPGAARRVRLFTKGTVVVLVISDDGPGPGAAAEAGAAGLLGVRDRLAAVGGTLSVTASDPGTRVEVRVPGTRQHLVEPGVGSDAAHGEPLLASRAPTSEVSP